MLCHGAYAAETPSTPDVEVHPGLRKEGLAPFKLPPHPLRRLLYGSGCRWLGTPGSHATCANTPRRGNRQDLRDFSSFFCLLLNKDASKKNICSCAKNAQIFWWYDII